MGVGRERATNLGEIYIFLSSIGKNRSRLFKKNLFSSPSRKCSSGRSNDSVPIFSCVGVSCDSFFCKVIVVNVLSQTSLSSPSAESRTASDSGRSVWFFVEIEFGRAALEPVTCRACRLPINGKLSQHFVVVNRTSLSSPDINSRVNKFKWKKLVAKLKTIYIIVDCSRW